jgi:hypothetical protein
MSNRFILDYDNPDAGIGHSMGIINRALKIANRNQLQFAYSESQLKKSHSTNFRWRLKQFLRQLRGKRGDETHNIGDDLNVMLNPSANLPSREEIERKIRRGEIQLIPLPPFEIHIPSNDQLDEEVYKTVDEFIQHHSQPNIAFKISNNRFGDYEYATTIDWFKDAYQNARKLYPIDLSFDPKKMNIAIHIRRGDLLPGRQFSDLSSRMLPDEWYLKILRVALSAIHKPVAIHIYSEGKDGRYYSEAGTPFSWKQYFADSPHEIHEHIDGDFLSTFHHLMNADLLIGSKSGMSHLAGMLNQNIKIMPKMWHSYRGADKLLEVSSINSELSDAQITSHLQKMV